MFVSGGRVSLRGPVRRRAGSAAVAGTAPALSASRCRCREQSPNTNTSRQESASQSNTGGRVGGKGGLAGKPPVSQEQRPAPACCDWLSEFAGRGARASRHPSARLGTGRQEFFRLFTRSDFSLERGQSLRCGRVFGPWLSPFWTAEDRMLPLPWAGREPQKGRCLGCSRFHVAWGSVARGLPLVRTSSDRRRCADGRHAASL